MLNLPQEKHPLLSEQDFKDSLFAQGYDRSYAIILFDAIGRFVVPAVSQIETVESLTVPIPEAYLHNPESLASQHKIALHKRIYTRQLRVAARTSESIFYEEENREGRTERLLSVPNLALVADKLPDVRYFGPKRVTALGQLITACAPQP
jgi:hypothetical protein